MVPVSPGRSGIHAKLITCGQKEKDKHGFEGRPPLTLLKILQLQLSPSPPCSAQTLSLLAPQNEAQDTQEDTLLTPTRPQPPPQGSPGRGLHMPREVPGLTLGPRGWGGQPVQTEPEQRAPRTQGWAAEGLAGTPEAVGLLPVPENPLLSHTFNLLVPGFYKR